MSQNKSLFKLLTDGQLAVHKEIVENRIKKLESDLAELANEIGNKTILSGLLETEKSILLQIDQVLASRLREDDEF